MLINVLGWNVKCDAWKNILDNQCQDECQSTQEMHNVKKLQIPESGYLTPALAAWLGNFILTSSHKLFFQNIFCNPGISLRNFLVRHHTTADESYQDEHKVRETLMMFMIYRQIQVLCCYCWSSGVMIIDQAQSGDQNDSHLHAGGPHRSRWWVTPMLQS